MSFPKTCTRLWSERIYRREPRRRFCRRTRERCITCRSTESMRDEASLRRLSRRRSGPKYSCRIVIPNEREGSKRRKISRFARNDKYRYFGGRKVVTGRAEFEGD